MREHSAFWGSLCVRYWPTSVSFHCSVPSSLHRRDNLGLLSLKAVNFRGLRTCSFVFNGSACFCQVEGMKYSKVKSTTRKDRGRSSHIAVQEYYKCLFQSSLFSFRCHWHASEGNSTNKWQIGSSQLLADRLDLFMENSVDGVLWVWGLYFTNKCVMIPAQCSRRDKRYIHDERSRRSASEQYSLWLRNI